MAQLTVTDNGGLTGTSTVTITVTTDAPSAPTVTSVSPGSAQQGQAANVILTGTNFVDGATSNFGSGITVNSLTFDSSTQLTAAISVFASAAIGPRDVTVTNPDLQFGTFTDGFSVTAASSGIIHKDFSYSSRTALLADGWSFLAKTPAGASRDTEQSGAAGVDYDQTAHPGTLRVPVGPGDIYLNTLTSRNTLFRDLPSDWTSIRLKIAAFDPAANYQQVGLVVYQDDGNYAMLDRGTSGVPLAEYYREQGDVVLGDSTFTPFANTGNLILRLDKDAAPDSWTGHFSIDDGATWVSTGTLELALNTPKLGIHIGSYYGATIPNADLAWVEIIRPEPLPVISGVTADPITASEVSINWTTKRLIAR